MVAFLDEQAPGDAFSDIFAFELEDPRMAGTMEVALRWRDSGPEVVRSFANSGPTEFDGTHVLGFRRGLEAAVNAYARERQLLTATDADLGLDLICEGLTAVVSVKLEAPEFMGATHGKLGNSAACACVQEAVASHLGTWFDEHPMQAAAVIDLVRR
jgi:DNA gyrase subunit B